MPKQKSKIYNWGKGGELQNNIYSMMLLVEFIYIYGLRKLLKFVEREWYLQRKRQGDFNALLKAFCTAEEFCLCHDQVLL